MKKNIRLTKNPYLLFLPFLIILIIYVVLNPSKGDGDEGRYLMFAQNLAHGFYSPSPPHINLTNGPGYPIILVPFVAMGLPLLSITLLNPFFFYFSIIFLYKSLSQIASQNITYIFSFLWACYYLAYQNMSFVMTEPLTYLLISILIFSIVKSFKPGFGRETKKYIFLAGFILGYIVLTKIAFMYVFWVLFLGSFVLGILHKKNINYRKSTLIVCLGFLTLLPYIIYSYNLTGRMFYWNTNTGASMYWSSSPFKNEYGDWKQDLSQGTIGRGNYNIPGAGDSLIAHHGRDYYDIFKSKDFSQFGMAQDDAFKKIAIRNIKSHPLKYIQNCIYNAGRLIFHYPFSEALQRPKVLLVFPLNGIIFTLMIFCMVISFLNWQRLQFALRFLLIFAFLYIGLSTMVTAYVRMFTIIVPILIFWFAYIFQNSVKVNSIFEKPQ